MEPETVPAKALVGARERVEKLTKSMVAIGVAVAGTEFDSPDFRLEIEAAPEPQAALGMALAQAQATQNRLSKAIATESAALVKAKADAEAATKGGDEAAQAFSRTLQKLVKTGAYSVCKNCLGAVTDAKGQKCGACEDGIVARKK